MGQGLITKKLIMIILFVLILVAAVWFLFGGGEKILELFKNIFPDFG
jgi:hypothetical protein